MTLNLIYNNVSWFYLWWLAYEGFSEIIVMQGISKCFLCQYQKKVFLTFDDFLSDLPIQKICKKLKYHDGVLSYQPIWQHLFCLLSKVQHGISIFFVFFEILCQICRYNVSIKKVVKFWTYVLFLVFYDTINLHCSDVTSVS